MNINEQIVQFYQDRVQEYIDLFNAEHCDHPVSEKEMEFFKRQARQDTVTYFSKRGVSK